MRTFFSFVLFALLFASPLQANERPVHYFAIEPPFVVNVLEGPRARHMQVRMQIMTHDRKVIAKLEEHMPAIRHGLIMLLSGQSGETVRSTAGVEQLRLEALEVMRETLAEVAGLQDGIEELYFTDRVVQ